MVSSRQRLTNLMRHDIACRPGDIVKKGIWKFPLKHKSSSAFFPVIVSILFRMEECLGLLRSHTSLRAVRRVHLQKYSFSEQSFCKNKGMTPEVTSKSIS